MTSVLTMAGHRRKTKMRTTQVDDVTWGLAVRIAAIRGETMAAVMRDAVRRYVARHRHLLDEPDEHRA